MSARRIVLTSGKGGVGKTTTTANLGAALAKRGKKVSWSTPTSVCATSTSCWASRSASCSTWSKSSKGRCQLRQALIKDKRLENLSILPAAQTRDKTAISELQMTEVVEQLGELCDFVLIDCPAGIEHGFRNAIAGASEAIVVTTPEVSAIRDADRVIGKLHERGLPLRLIVNRIRPEMVRSGDMLSVDDVTDILSAELLGIVPDDEEVIDTTNRGEPIALQPDSRLAAIYDKIARRLDGELGAVHPAQRAGFLRRALPQGRMIACTRTSPCSPKRRRRARRRASAGGRSSSPAARAASARPPPPRTSAPRSARPARSVVLVDADVGLRNLDIVLGLEARVRHHVLDVLEGVSTLDDALVTDKRVPSAASCSPPRRRARRTTSTPTAFAALISSLRERFDYVLIDCPAGIEKGFTNAIVGADEAIVVCTPEVSAVRDADRVVGLLGDDRSSSLIVNRLRPSLVKRGKMLSVDDVNGILRLPLLGVIADAPDVIVSTNRGEPVALDPASPIGAAYRAIAGRIDGTDSSAPEIPREKSFLEKLFGSKR